MHVNAAHLKLLELFALSRVFLALADDQQEVLGEHEGDALAVDAELLLHVAQEVAEVYVEDLAV
jgi:hypothetical protein